MLTLQYYLLCLRHQNPVASKRRRKNIEAGNPFKKYGYYPKVATLSKRKYLEFHDKDSIVSIGSVRFNRKTKEIVGFREIDLSDPDAQPYLDTAGRWFSPDPLSEEYSSWSPYNMVMNNPIKNIDPDGRGVLDNFQLLQNGQVKLLERTNDSSDTLFASDKKGNIDKSKSVTVDKPTPQSGSIINDLSGGGIPDNSAYGYLSGQDGQKMFPLGVNRARTTNASDIGNVFTFAAKYSNVEWGLAAYETGSNMTYAIYTGHNIDRTPDTILKQGLSKLSFEIHSHPGGTSPNSGDFNSSKWLDGKFSNTNYPRHFLLSAPRGGQMGLYEYHEYNGQGPKIFYPGKSNVKSPMLINRSFNPNTLRK